jgi:hypothetical protein
MGDRGGNASVKRTGFVELSYFKCLRADYRINSKSAIRNSGRGVLDWFMVNIIMVELSNN